MKRRHKRIIFIVCCVFALGLAAWLVLTALRNNLQFFATPTEVATKGSSNTTIRLGGLVEVGSIKREGTLTRFTMTDTTNKVPVVYNGITPDLFKDGRGCVVIGRMGSDRVFHADTVMAKHDENYMPPEAGSALDKARVEKTLSQQQ